MDFNDILNNDTVKGLLKKYGVSDDQASSVVEQAAGSIKSKFEKDPSQMASLLSENKNTEKDEVMKKEVENDFLDGLIQKVGLPEVVADKVKGALPGILEQVSSKFSGADGASGILDKVTDMFGGDDKSKSSGKKDDGLLGKITDMF